jgi:hypothetical protein
MFFALVAGLNGPSLPLIEPMRASPPMLTATRFLGLRAALVIGRVTLSRLLMLYSCNDRDLRAEGDRAAKDMVEWRDGAKAWGDGVRGSVEKLDGVGMMV